MKTNQGMIVFMLYGICGAFGSADWITHAIGRLLFMLIQMTMVQLSRRAEEDDAFNANLHIIFVLGMFVCGETHFYLVTRQ